MQCRCRKIIITRRVVNKITDPVMRDICHLLMSGLNLQAVRAKLKLPLIIFDTFVEEIRLLLIKAGLEVRSA